MARVVTPGDGNRAACGFCKSVIEFEPHDIHVRESGRDDEGDPLYSYSVTCPGCHQVIHPMNLTRDMMSRAIGITKERERLSDHDL